MMVTKAGIYGFFLGGISLATSVWGWLSNTSPAVITGVIGGVAGGIMMAWSAKKKQDIEIRRLNTQADAEEAAIHRKECEERNRLLEAKVDKQVETIGQLREVIARWETKYSTKPEATAITDTKPQQFDQAQK